MRRGAMIAAGLALATAPAAADPVAVRVVEVAGELAYLEPGAEAGLAAGTKVTIAGRELAVVEVNARTAAVRTGDAPLAAGASGIADVAAGGAAAGAAVRTLPPVRPPETWVAQWPEPVMPAASQHPTPHPLGHARTGRVEAALIVHGVGHLADDGEVVAGGEARAAVSIEAWPAHEVWADLDVAGRAFTAGSAGARTPLVVHAARVRVGAAGEPRLEAGRLPWVAGQVGALDGVHASHRLGALVVGGFAGLVPGDLDAQPRATAARFGAELGWDAPSSPWRPRIDVVVAGSTWEGRLDERRLTVDAEVTRGALRGRAWGEAQGFAADNPWNASAIEVTAAGAGAGWWRRGRHLDVDVTYQRPERSLRLAATAPVDWLCLGASTGAEAGCADASWTDVAVSAGAAGARWAIDGGADVGVETAAAAAGDTFAAASAFALVELRVLPGGARLQLGGSGGRARFVDWYGGEAGVALGGRRWDARARWRPELIAYTGALDRVWQQGVQLDGRWRVRPDLSLAASALGTAGDDRNAVTVAVTLAWRPLP